MRIALPPALHTSTSKHPRMQGIQVYQIVVEENCTGGLPAKTVKAFSLADRL